MTQTGEVKLKVPKLRKLTFEASIIEHYKRREASVEEALIEISTTRRVRTPGGGCNRSRVGQPRCRREPSVSRISCPKEEAASIFLLRQPLLPLSPDTSFQIRGTYPRQ